MEMSMNDTLYRSIGKGFCGSVWTLEGTDTVIKREDGGPGRSLTNDYNMHILVLQNVARYLSSSSPIRIPRCHTLVQSTDAWWHNRLRQFPHGYSACRTIISERIPKVPRQISDKIVDLFCSDSPELSEFVKNNEDDDPCLIRPYLGRRRRHNQTRSTSQFRRFSLRNVPLHIDQMEMLGLNTEAYAKAMAEALAIMHWGAGIDANDVEFVLAPSKPESSTPSMFLSNYLGAHCLWILDFDCCRPISMDIHGVEKACAAFFKNDPFYPRPASEEPYDRDVWTAFRKTFLAVSQRILQGCGELEVLPGMLIDTLEKEGAKRRNRK